MTKLVLFLAADGVLNSLLSKKGEHHLPDRRIVE